MSSPTYPYAAVVLKLLRDAVYYDDTDWGLLLTHQTAVQQHFAALGLALHLDEAEGYAYLTQPDPDPDDPNAVDLPRLVSRRSLSYDATLLSVLLRERLQQFDAEHPDDTRLVLNLPQLAEMMHLFYAEQADMTRLDRRIESIIKQVVRIGFLQRVGKKEEGKYEVKRIIKAKISADKLSEIRDLLARHLDEEA